MKDWVDALTKALENIGRDAHLSEIYREIEKIGTELPSTWQEVVRERLLRNSSDSTYWDGLYDVFEKVDDRKGVWRLRNLKNTKIKDMLSFEFDDHAETDESQKVLRIWHARREKNAKLLKRKKYQIKKKKGFLSCEVCNFNFSDFYGPRGEDFIECHHVIPLSKLEPATKTTLNDLALVCSNCHRMLHRSKDLEGLDGLREEIKFSKKQL